MASTPAWKPAETVQGGRAFTTTIADVDVLVTFAGDATGALAGEWAVRDADDDTLLLTGSDPALAGSRSAVQIFGSLVSIADQLTPLLVPEPVATPLAVEYKVVKLAAHDDDAVFVEAVAATLGGHAADGWRLVCVDNLWAYLERPDARANP